MRGVEKARGLSWSGSLSLCIIDDYYLALRCWLLLFCTGTGLCELR